MNILGVLAVLAVPIAFAQARSGDKITLAPEVSPILNSQTMSLLTGFRNINPTNLGTGQIAIVDNSALSTESDGGSAFVEAGKSGNGEISVYVVRPGDSLGSIAKMFNVSVNTIKWANDISGSIQPGDKLVILPISGVKYAVKKGDTVSSIAKKFNADINDIVTYNGISKNSQLAAGDEIIIPDGEVSVPSSSPSSGSSVNGQTQSGNKTYSGYYMRPIAGGVRSQGIHGHNAVDLAAAYGTPIMAAADGTVIISKVGGWNGGYGTYVAISHPNGTQTVYGHMSTDAVKVGEHVEQGEVIGKIGMTGNTSGPHVHFEIRGAKNPF